MIKKHIPNSITCCNLVSGCIATVYALAGNAETTLLWIIIGAVFDFYDGMAARLLHVSSPIGKELDSLADDITFGMAPSAIIFSQLQMMSYPAFLEPLRFYLPFAAFIMAAFSASALPSSILTSVRHWGSSDCRHRPTPSSGDRSSWASVTESTIFHGRAALSWSVSSSAPGFWFPRFRCSH